MTSPGRSSSYRFLVISIIQLSIIMSNAITEGPKFAEPIPNVTVALGRDASLPCVVENLGNYKVAWIHIDRQMILTIHRHVIARVSRFSVSHDNHRTWLLNVNQVHQEDRGYYMCQVNTNPMISQVGYLQVVVPPNIVDAESTPSSVAVRENQNLTLVCKAEGIPAPKLSWRREDGQAITIDRKTKVQIQEGEQLNLTRITRAEMGAYLCIASNSVPPSVSKRIIIDVEFSPMIWVPNQLVGAPAGTDVTIECNTEAYPKAISYWVYDGNMILPTKKYVADIQENSYRTYMRLTVRHLSAKDFGSYRCISKNSLGETEGSIRLYEIPSPSQQPRTTSDGNRTGKQANKQGNRPTLGPKQRRPAQFTRRPSATASTTAPYASVNSVAHSTGRRTEPMAFHGTLLFTSLWAVYEFHFSSC
ncbi:Immunoglobulin V-set domain [Nesidiocoris tenuis]|uniref:Immunoglobulin V-set domain n=1 Tax=Nesidiocoris tenuis TaxID=355587 RepID=A0ABN7ARQ1_9HEMI|nr:Immunoglobulin V-set domain [Nesidiocoris tenuis]